MIEIPKSSPRQDVIRLNEEKPTSTPLVSRNSFCRRLQRGVDARAKFVESHINRGIAYQLRSMREARSWSQQQLAREVDMPQTAISRLESSAYGKPTITTLKRIAKVYDVALEVRFVPFSKLVNRISGTPYIEYGLDSDALDVPSFEEELEAGHFLSTEDAPSIVVPKKPARTEPKTPISPFELAAGMTRQQKERPWQAERKSQQGPFLKELQPPFPNEEVFQLAAGAGRN